MAKPTRKTPSKTAKKAKAKKAKPTKSKKLILRRAKTKKPQSKPPAAASRPAPPDTSKHSIVLEMLNAPGGVTIAAIMKATDWQQHSVRGFLAGTVRKKLGLDLVSRKVDGKRVYRIGGEGRAS